MADEQKQSSSDNEAMQALIGEQLRTMYEDVLSEPVPDKIVELLAKLEAIPAPQIPPADDDSAPK